MRQYIAFARVSSEQQKREGFSLEDQEAKLHQLAAQSGGTIVQLYKVAETASKRAQRTTFREMLTYAKKHHRRLSGVLFVKIDRATRNLADWVELEALEAEYHVPLIFPDQPSGETPEGRFQRRTFNNVAAYQVESQALRIRDGHRKRVETGLSVGAAAYSYSKIRVDGRSMVRVHTANGPKVKRIFELYAYHGHTLDSLIQALFDGDIFYSEATPRFPRSVLHRLLVNRVYIGENRYQEQWHPGTHEQLVDRATFDRVQQILGGRIYRAHEMTYAGELIVCGHCGHPVTGELKRKRTPFGEERAYIYYRCGKYNAPGHPRTRLTEPQVDAQMLALFDRLQLKDPEAHALFVDVIRAKAGQDQEVTEQRLQSLNQQRPATGVRLNRLTNMRLNEEINPAEYARKRAELREQEDALAIQIDACGRDRHETADLAVKAFELSQSLRSKWAEADYAAKRTILEIVCLNFTLDGTTLAPIMRKPFDLLVEGPVSERIGAMGI